MCKENFEELKHDHFYANMQDKYPLLKHALLLASAQGNYDIEHFLEKCKNEDIRDLVIGGIFGDSCVWQIATETSFDIYSQQIGEIPPSFRQFLMPAKIFNNAYIVSEITEGNVNSELKLPRYVCFKPAPFYSTLGRGYFTSFEEKIPKKSIDHIYQSINSAPIDEITSINLPLI